MEIGERLLIARKKAGLNQNELAEKLKISPVNISQLENGDRTPRTDTIKKITNILGISVYEILPEDVKEQFSDLKKYLNSTTLTEEEESLLHETVSILLNNSIMTEIYDKLYAATCRMDKFMLSQLQDISDEYLQETLIKSFNELNRLGKIEAVQRVAEMETAVRFRKSPHLDNSQHDIEKRVDSDPNSNNKNSLQENDGT